MTSQPIVLDSIPFHPDEAHVVERLGPGAAGAEAELQSLILEASRIARPKAVYRPCDVERIDGDSVVIEGVHFESRLLCMNLKDARRVFPYVATCGRELAEWAGGMHDPLSRYWADGISELALAAARERLMSVLRAAHGLARSSAMNPGSLPEWPLSEQGSLFRLIGDVDLLVGVTLTESFLMLPVKSVSGIMFPLEVDFENCMLCPRDTCTGRRAAYDPGLRARRFSKEAPDA
jgi:hypothetical protein